MQDRKNRFCNMRGWVLRLLGLSRGGKRRKIEVELQESRDQLALILDEMSDGLAVIDPDGYILFCNEKYSSLFPLSGPFRKPGAYLPSVLLLARDLGEMPGNDVKIAMQKLKDGMDNEVRLFNGCWLHLRSSPTAFGNTIILVSDITAIKRAFVDLSEMTKKLELLADTDGLTGVSNRRSLDEKLEKEAARCRRSGQPISVIMIDIDRFKAFNDTYGHQAGDECLKLVAKTLGENVKRPADFIARYGGEEFCAVLPETDLAGAFALAEQLRLAVAALALEHKGSEKRFVSISAGVACSTNAGNTSAELISSADAALYHAKNSGRNRVACSNDQFDKRWRQ